MLQLLLNADEDGVTEFSDRGIAKATEIPYQQVRTIHQRWLADGIISNAVANAATNANHVHVTICDYASYNIFNTFSNAVTNAVTNAVANALKDKEIIREKDKVFPENPIPTEKENNKEKDGKEDAFASKKKQATFVKPTIEEVSSYVAEKGYHFDAEKFHSHYESNGWMVGKNKMKDWKAACRTWESQHKEKRVDKPDEKQDELSMTERFTNWVIRYYPCVSNLQMPTEDQLKEMLNVCDNHIEGCLDQLQGGQYEGSLYDLFMQRFGGN